MDKTTVPAKVLKSTFKGFNINGGGNYWVRLLINGEEVKARILGRSGLSSAWSHNYEGHEGIVTYYKSRGYIYLTNFELKK